MTDELKQWAEDRAYDNGYQQGRADREEEIFKFLEEHYTACTNDGDYYGISEIRKQLKEQMNEKIQALRKKEEKPKYHKGKYGAKYDYWTCGNCGRTLSHDVSENYCWNCGHRVLWENPRCLTGYKDGVNVE